MTGERRNRGWYGMIDKDGFVRRSWMENQGFPDHVLQADQGADLHVLAGKDTRPVTRESH